MSARPGPLAAGFAATSHRKLVLLLALTAAVLGASAALPLLPTLRETMVETLAGDHFARNHPTFAPTDFVDLMREKDAAVDGTRRAANGMALVGVLLQVFFAGGIVVVLGAGPFSFNQFFEPARRNFWHNVKCLFLFALAGAVALGIWLGAGFALRKRMLENAAPDSALWSLTYWFLVVVGLWIFARLSLVYDFARAARRYAPQIGAWRAFRWARRVQAGARGRTLGLWIFWFVFGGGLWVLLVGVTWLMPARSRPAIALLMLLQFAVLYVRSAVRVAAWGSYVAFLEPRARPALSEIARVSVRAEAPPAAIAP